MLLLILVMVNYFGILGMTTSELLIIFAVVLLLFGAKKLPELSKSLGQSARELRKGLSDDVKTKENKVEG